MEHQGMSPVLREIALEPLRYLFAAGEETLVTYNALDYIEKLAAALYQWAGAIYADPEWSLMLLLADENVNSMPACEYCIAWLQVHLKKTRKNNKKLKKLDAWYTQLHYRISPGSGARHPDAYPLRLLLEDWVLRETPKTEGGQTLPVVPAVQPYTAPGPRPKIKSCLSVALEGIWIRAEIFAGKISGHNLTQTMKLWSRLLKAGCGKIFRVETC